MFLAILDCYPAQDRDLIREHGGTPDGLVFQELAQAHARGVGELQSEVLYLADITDAGTSPGRKIDFTVFDAVLWSGSTLTIHDQSDKRVGDQIELAQHLFARDMPIYGSCWGAQIAAMAAGGQCTSNPSGREFGATEVWSTDQGNEHAMFAGKGARFQVFQSHLDHICDLGSAVRLSTNDWTPVQAIDVAMGQNHFWAVQYHPEWDVTKVAAIASMRRREFVAEGRFDSEAAVVDWVEQLRQLPKTGDDALAETLGIGPTLRDQAIRTREITNWLTAILSPD